MRKTELTQMTIGQLKHTPAHIDRLYDELRNSMSAPTALALPFDITKKGASLSIRRLSVSTTQDYQ